MNGARVLCDEVLLVMVLCDVDVRFRVDVCVVVCFSTMLCGLFYGVGGVDDAGGAGGVGGVTAGAGAATTTTVRVTVPTFPAASVALYSMLCVPATDVSRVNAAGATAAPPSSDIV